MQPACSAQCITSPAMTGLWKTRCFASMELMAMRSTSNVSLYEMQLSNRHENLSVFNGTVVTCQRVSRVYAS